MGPGTAVARPALSAEGFARFLGRLGEDPAAAAVEYVRIQDGLARFFAWRGSSCPEDHADQTLDRMARRLDEGARVAHLRAYAYGVARHVLREAARRERRRRAALQARPQPAAADEEEALWERGVPCLRRCLDELPRESRELLVEYHLRGDGSRFEWRRRLARRLGITPGALRTRVHRIRLRLEQRLRAALASGA